MEKPKTLRKRFFRHTSSHVSQSLLGQRRWNVELGKTFNLSYHMINSDGKLQSYAHVMVFKKLVAKPRWPPKSPPKSIQTRIFIWPMLCESLKKKAVLVFSVSMGNRLEIDLQRIIIIIIVIGFRKQNRPRGLSVYNNNNNNNNNSHRVPKTK